MHSTLKLKDGTNLAFKLEGDSGCPVVLISGLGGTSAFWDKISYRLSPQCRVLSFDQRGIGGSDCGIAETSLDCLTIDLCELVENVFPGEKVTMLGHSTGGVISQIFASRYSEKLDSLVISGSWVEADGYIRHLFDFRKRLLTQAPELYLTLSNILSYTPEEGGDDFWRHAGENNMPMHHALQRLMSERIDALLSYSGNELAKKINIRTLVIGAWDDQVIPFYHQKQLACVLPQSHFSEIKKGGHFFPQTQTEKFVSLVNEWIHD